MTKSKKSGPWQSAETDLLRELAQRGATAEDIASELGRTAASVRAKTRRERVGLRSAGHAGTNRWFGNQLQNLKKRMERIAGQVVAQRNKFSTTALKCKLNDNHETLKALMAFAHSHNIRHRRYSRLLDAIKESLAAVRTKLAKRKSIQWREVLAVVQLVIGVLVNFATLLDKAFGLAATVAA